MFLSQDGVVLCTTLRALDELGLLETSLDEEAPLRTLHPELTEPGFGALRVAIRSLAGVGWLAEPATMDPETTRLRWTEQGRMAMERRPAYIAVGRLLSTFSGAADEAWTQPWSPAQIEAYAELSRDAAGRWSTEALPAQLGELVTAHLDGALMVPAMLWLHETGRLSDEGPAFPDDGLGQALGEFLTSMRWIEPGGGWTEAGETARRYALNFGGVATYLPLLARLPELYRGELTVSPELDGSPEWHVHRALNLTISSVAHRRYFADSDDVFIEIFNREPVSEQPRFVADMGCGEGAWLTHLHEVISERTLRGRSLESDPLTMVGIDPSSTAMARARARFEAAGVSGVVIPGDVTDPEGLRATLAEHGLAIEDGLHIRAFIDHERGYLGDGEEIEVPGWSTGAYLDGAGAAISGESLERDLVAHLRRWAPHVRKHGLFVLEAHCVAPAVTARHLGAQHSVALDAHQAYSKQYPVDHAAWMRCCREAGLQAAGYSERRFPSTLPFVAVSVQRLLAPGDGSPLPAIRSGQRGVGGWEPEAGTDLEDGEALHRILFQGGDIRYPAAWCSAPTGYVVAGALEAIEHRLDRGGEGEVIRVLDYGAGTGTATIELLKACRERGLEARLERLGMELEVHLVDLPSSWFARGYELLRDCAWTRFHSLRADDGGFRPLSEAVDGVGMDAVMANMVFHLIPPRALARTAEGIASVLGPAGRLLWSSPDLGPPGTGAVLLHEPNRMLRKRWLERAEELLDPETVREAQRRAERRILPDPLASDVVAALEPHFQGAIETRGYEMLADDVLAGLLVPSNQAEYLPEIEDRSRREELIRELMTEEVIPALQEGPAGTALGLNLHWTLGSYAKS